MTATVLPFPTPAPKDGGKARIQAGRIRKGLTAEQAFFAAAQAISGGACDLRMDHTDPEDTVPSEYVAPVCDG